MVVGVKGRPLFTRPAAVWHHLQRLRQYNSERWAHQQQQRVARRKHKQRRVQWKPEASPGGDLGQRERCPGKGGAKKTAGAYASDFYAGPIIPQGARKGPQYQVVEPENNPYRMQGQRSSHRHSAAPRPDARSSTPGCHAFGFARHTNTDPAPHALRRDGGFGTAGHEGMSGIPAPLRSSAVDRPGPRAEQGRRGCAHREGGGPPQRRGPSDASRSQCEEARPPREDGGTLIPPPPREAGASDAAQRGQA